MLSFVSRLGFVALVLLGVREASAQSLMAYIEAPGTATTGQSSSFAGAPGAETETFNSLPIGNQSTPYVSAIGTFQFSSSAQGAIIAADQYGGAYGTHYMSFGAQSGTSAPITINLNGTYNSFGFWFSAGDANNGVTFYSNGTQFARFSTADILNLLSGTTVTALDGTKYNSSSYFGNPNNLTQDTSEPFAYVEIITTGETFNQVVLDNSGTTGTGFESDNYTVASGTFTAPGTDVFVSSLTVVPEPSRYTLVFGACILVLVAGRKYLGRILPGYHKTSGVLVLS